MNSVFCCFAWEKSTKFSPNPGLVNQFSATPRGQLNWTGPIANGSEIWKKGKDPHPQDKSQHLDFTKDPGRFTTRPLPVYFTTKMSVVRPFSVLSKDEIGP